MYTLWKYLHFPHTHVFRGVARSGADGACALDAGYQQVTLPTRLTQQTIFGPSERKPSDHCVLVASSCPMPREGQSRTSQIPRGCHGVCQQTVNHINHNHNVAYLYPNHSC